MAMMIMWALCTVIVPTKGVLTLLIPATTVSNGKQTRAMLRDGEICADSFNARYLD